MTKVEAIIRAISAAIEPDSGRAVAFEAKLRECGFWIAPMEPTDKMIDAVYAHNFKYAGHNWALMRYTFLSEESK